MQPINQQPTLSPRIEDYCVANRFYRIDSSVAGNDTMVFIKGSNRALIFLDDTIEYKEAAGAGPTNSVNVLFNPVWDSKTHFKGFDGQNEFHLMMLLDMMGAIKLSEVNKKIRQDICMKNLLTQIPQLYEGLQVNEIENADAVI